MKTRLAVSLGIIGLLATLVMPWQVVADKIGALGRVTSSGSESYILRLILPARSTIVGGNATIPALMEDANGTMLRKGNTPGSSAYPCTTGQMWFDNNATYVCTQANVVKKAGLSLF